MTVGVCLQLFDGNYNYNILDQGGAIVAVADSTRDKTNTILYVADQPGCQNQYNAGFPYRMLGV